MTGADEANLVMCVYIFFICWRKSTTCFCGSI